MRYIRIAPISQKWKDICNADMNELYEIPNPALIYIDNFIWNYSIKE